MVAVKVGLDTREIKYIYITQVISSYLPRPPPPNDIVDLSEK